MGSRQLVYTFPATAPSHSTPIAAGVLPAFTGTFTITTARTGDNAAGTNFRHTLARTDSTVCWQNTLAIPTSSNSSTSSTITVGSGSPTWSCTDFANWSIVWPTGATQPKAGSVWTWTISGPNVPDPAPCPYGTEPIPGTSLVLPITSLIVDQVLDHFTSHWAAPLFSMVLGFGMDMNKLCSSIPPTWPTIDVTALLNDVSARLVLFQALAWHVFCQCKAGTPTPTPFPEPTPVQPPGWPVLGPYPCTNSDICTTLLTILRKLDDLQMTQTIVSNQTTTIVNPASSLFYDVGTVHSALSGSGSFSVAGLIGVRAQLTSGPPSSILPGQPRYLWDLGWLSVTDGGAMLQERRFTRDAQEWFPAEMSLATQLGYFFNPGVTGTLTELKRKPIQ